MPAVAYAMRDLYPSADGRVPAGCVSVPAHRGGCGVPHEVVPDANGRYHVACDRCAAPLISGSYGWGSAPAQVPLTPDEVGERELAKRDAEAAQGMILKAMTDSFMAQLAAGQAFLSAPAPPKSLAEQVATMTDADKAALRALLGDTPAQASVAAKATKARRVAG